MKRLLLTTRLRRFSREIIDDARYMIQDASQNCILLHFPGVNPWDLMVFYIRYLLNISDLEFRIYKSTTYRVIT